jgi:electron transport complex protein RnfA
MIPLASLAIFSGFSLNLLLQFALGTAGAAIDSLPAGSAGRRRLPFFQFFVHFVSVLFLWVFFTHIMPSRWGGFSEYFLFFPFSALVCMGSEFLGERFIPRPPSASGSFLKVFSAFTAYDGLVPVSLLITLTLAANFTEAFVLVLFFVLGNMAAMLVLYEVRRRSEMEWVPRHLRGSPLILVSMGLLSLIASSAAVLFFRMLGR